jgi:hypothetical protein
MLLAISIDSDHMFFFFFFHACRCISSLVELVLKRVEDIIMMSFFMQYAICIYILHSKYFYLIKL